MFYLMMDVTHFIFWIYGLGHMVKNNGDRLRGNLLLPLHRLLCLIFGGFYLNKTFPSFLPTTQFPQLPHLFNSPTSSNPPPLQLPHLFNSPTSSTPPPLQLPHLFNSPTSSTPPPLQLPHLFNSPTSSTPPPLRLPHLFDSPTSSTPPPLQLPHLFSSPTSSTPPPLQLPLFSSCLWTRCTPHLVQVCAICHALNTCLIVHTSPVQVRHTSNTPF